MSSCSIYVCACPVLTPDDRIFPDENAPSGVGLEVAHSVFLSGFYTVFRTDSSYTNCAKRSEHNVNLVDGSIPELIIIQAPGFHAYFHQEMRLQYAADQISSGVMSPHSSIAPGCPTTQTAPFDANAVRTSRRARRSSRVVCSISSRIRTACSFVNRVR